TALKRIVGVMSGAGADVAQQEAQGKGDKRGRMMRMLGLDPKTDRISRLRPADFFRRLGDSLRDERNTFEDRMWLMNELFEQRAKTPALVLSQVADELPAAIQMADDAEAYELDVANAIHQDYAELNRSLAEAEELLDTPGGTVDQQVEQL